MISASSAPSGDRAAGSTAAGSTAAGSTDGVAAGDDPATDFTAVYDRHFAAVHHYVAGRLGGQIAEDVVADVFIAALSGRDRFDSAKGDVTVWLLGIATRHIARHHRAETARYRALARQAAAAAEGISDDDVVQSAVAARTLDPLLTAALADLTRKERDVVLLAAIGELSHEEIARTLGIPFGTVGSRQNRARRKLRTAMAGDSTDSKDVR